jgi:zinc protease
VRYKLDNGLTVVLQPQRTAPVAALQVWVKAGSADEAPEEAGLAHLHEHMLFKGTARRGSGEIARDIEARGGEINAWTSFDQTVYHLVLASPFFSDGLDILADAVRASSFDPAELAREIEVVMEEIKRSQDLPSRRMSRAMFETAYGEHPYRWPILGTEKTVKSFDRAGMLDFFRRHYTPDNIVLVVAGDLDEEQARRQIERHFGGDWGKRHAGHLARKAEPRQHEPRFAIAFEPINEAQFALAYHIAELTSPDIPALDLLAVILGQGEGSRLSLGLKIERTLASEVYAYAYTPKDPGLLVVGAMLAPETVKEAVEAMLVELRRLQLTPVDDGELAVAKRIIDADSIYGRETVQGVARKLGFYEAVAGDLDFERLYYERIAQVTPQALLEVARRYLGAENLTFAAVFPQATKISEPELRELVARVCSGEPAARAARPAPASQPPRHLSPPRVARHRSQTGIERAKLASGATVLVKPERNVPLVALRAVWPGGLRHETEQNNGVSQLYSRLMTRSTACRGAAEIAHEIDQIAGSIQGSAGRNSIGLRGEFLARHFDRAMDLVAECLTQPGFDPQELERERSLLLQDIRARDDNPAGAIFELFTRTLFVVHPYRFDTLGEQASVQALSLEGLRALKAGPLHLSNLTLAIVGDIDPDRAFALAEELFDRADGLAQPAPAVPLEPAQDAPRRVFRELDREQAHLIYGFPGVTVSSPERFAIDVLSSVLSGQGGRLFVELRDKRSMAYSISSFSVEGIDPGYFGVYMGTSPEKVPAAFQAICEELDKLAQTPISAAELDRAKRYLVGAHAIGLQKNSARAALIAYDDAYGTGADSYLQYDAQIEAVTPEMVLGAARSILDPRRGTLAVLGRRTADMSYVGG